MIAPGWVCHELERLNPKVRLGWQGRDRAEDGELNPGQFMLLELVQVRRADATFRTPWADRGPIYGSQFDRLTQVPLMVYDVTSEDVFSGRVVHLLRRWQTPITQRVQETWEKRRKEDRSAIRSIAEEAGKEMYWRAHRDVHRPQVVAQKFVTEKEKSILTGEWEAKRETKTAPSVAPVSVL